LSSIPDYFRLIAEFIAREYPSPFKIVEVGVGRTPFTALLLKRLIKNLRMVVVDKDPGIISELMGSEVEAVVDDVLSPKIEIYQNTDLIYSIRPPFELFSAIERLGELVGCDIIIIPLLEDAYLARANQRWKRIDISPRIIGLQRKIFRR
jgi:Uncharacterized protein conserved in archaea